MPLKFKLYLIISVLIIVIIYGACANLDKSSQMHYNRPDSSNLLAIQKTDSTIIMSNLNNGFQIYYGICTNCHKSYSIYAYSEKKWDGIINKMVPKTKITANDKKDLLNFILSKKLIQTN